MTYTPAQDETRTLLRGRIKKHFIEQIDGYVDHGVPLHGLLKLIAENDLKAVMETCFHNQELMHQLPDLMVYFLNFVPPEAWGEPGRHAEWLAIDRKPEIE